MGGHRADQHPRGGVLLQPPVRERNEHQQLFVADLASSSQRRRTRHRERATQKLPAIRLILPMLIVGETGE
ncbi:hypothetical protein GCM10023317_94000 [Actinopolymorpha pittospori]